MICYTRSLKRGTQRRTIIPILTFQTREGFYGMEGIWMGRDGCGFDLSQRTEATCNGIHWNLPLHAETLLRSTKNFVRVQGREGKGGSCF